MRSCREHGLRIIPLGCLQCAITRAKDGEVRRGAGSAFEFREGSDFVGQQVLPKDFGSKEKERMTL
jgi:hypothetical protein